MTPSTSAGVSRPANLLHALTVAGAAMVMLIVADLLVRAVPFRLIARRVQVPLRRTAIAGGDAARRVEWAIAAAHRRLPWTVPCLATAIAANRLLAWRGVASELWLGVHADAGASIQAHAWLVAEGRVVTGAAEKNQYRPLHALVTAPEGTR